MRILLIDLSSLFRPIWEMSGKEADQDYASKTTVARVHDMAHGFDAAAVCCDSRKSWRKELAPTYKAQRPKQEEPLYHQLRLVKEQLAADGFCVWEAEGYEADDCIGAAADRFFDRGHEVVIASSDKDLCQAVRVGEDGAFGSVSMKSLRSGELMGPAEVKAKFGVRPDQMRDWLCLVGDASDNIVGAKGIGAKRATELLQKHESLANIYANLGNTCDALGLTPSVFTALKESVHICELGRKLITLRTDVDLPFADIFKPRVAKTAPAELEDTMGEIIDGETGEVLPEPEQKLRPIPSIGNPTKAERLHLEAEKEKQSTAMVHVEWAQTLEPRSLSAAMTLASAIFASRQFAAYGTAEAVLLAIMTGRELGIGTMAAMRSIHIIEGKPTLSAALMAALVLRSGKAKQFEIIERTNERATIRCWRDGEEKPIDVTYSVDDAKRAGRVKPGSGWEKNPADMCVARCQAIGARLKWPDVVANMYLMDELGREEAA